MFFGFMLFARLPWVFENFLISDDLIIVPQALQGDCYWFPSGFLQWFILNNAFAILKDVIKVRIVYLILFSISQTFLYFALKRLINDYLYPFIIISVASLFPIYIDQAIFINGSHPFLGLAFMLFSVGALIHLIMSDRDSRVILYAAISFSMAVASIYCSPTSELAAIGGMALLLYPTGQENARLKRLMIISSSCSPVIIKQIHLGLIDETYNHYTQMYGWVSITWENIITQLNNGLKIIADTTGFQSLISIIILFVIACVVKYIFKRKTKAIYDEKNTLIVSLSFLLMSGLYFAPVSVLTQMKIRYLIGPIFFFSIAIGIAIFCIVRQNNYAKNILIFGLSAICFLFIDSSKDIGIQKFKHLVEKQKAIKGLCKEKSEAWKPDSQVIVICNKIPSGFTNGYNHWSTWFLRHISKRRDIIGLIGSQHWLDENPIISNYADHGEDFWSAEETKQGSRLERKRMVGIETGKPTYIYFEQNDGQFCQYNQLLIFVDEEYQIFSADEEGLNLLTRGLFEFNELCSVLDGKADTTIVFGDPKIKAYKIPRESDYSSVHYNGKGFDAIPIPEGNYAKLELVISSDKIGTENIPYSERTENFPPMPVYWEKLSLYQTSPNTYRIGKSNIFEKNNEAAMCIEVINNCGYMVNPSIGNPTIMLGKYYSKKPLILGRGPKKRYWKGTFKKIRIKVEDLFQRSIVLR